MVGWTIDNYDGHESWKRCKQRPRDEYKEDKELTTNQYHKVMCGLYQWESKPDDLVSNRSLKSEFDYGSKKKFVDVLGNVNPNAHLNRMRREHA